jgi:hypothetical protein
MTDPTAPEFTPESTLRTLLAACQAAQLDAKDAEMIRLGENALHHLPHESVVVRIARTMRYWATARARRFTWRAGSH